MEQVVSEIRAKLRENGITHFEIEGRPKHFYSIYKKMHDKGKTIDEIYDLYACRIIVDTLGQCYMALGIIHEMYNPIPGVSRIISRCRRRTNISQFIRLF